MSRNGSAEIREGVSVSHVKVESSRQLEEDYETGVKIGEGTFGTVIRAILKADGSAWAIKKIAKDRGGGYSSKSWEREIHILRQVRHPNIVNIREIVESDHHVFLVLELCEGGTLSDDLARVGRYTGPQARDIMFQIASVVGYLHKKSIVHRDLKLENVLLVKTHPDLMNGETPPQCSPTLKLTDFGLSVELRKSEHVMLEFCGTPLYIAPEIIAGKSYSRQCDVWSMGVIMHLLITGEPPFQSRTEEELYAEIGNADVLHKAATEVSKHAGSEACAALKGLLNPDPAHRLSAGEFLSEPWVTGGDRDGDGHTTTNVLQLMREFHRGEKPSSDPEQPVTPPEKSEKSSKPRGTTRNMKPSRSTPGPPGALLKKKAAARN